MTSQSTQIEDTSTTYQLREQAKQQKLAEFSAVADPADLSPELALCRYLLQEAIDAGNYELANDFLSTINELSKKHDNKKRPRGEPHQPAVLDQVAEEMADSVVKHFADCDRFAERVDALTTDFREATVALQDSEREVGFQLNAICG